MPRAAARCTRVVDDRAGVAALGAADELAAHGALAHVVELSRGRGAERVTGREEHRSCLRPSRGGRPCRSSSSCRRRSPRRRATPRRGLGVDLGATAAPAVGPRAPPAAPRRSAPGDAVVAERPIGGGGRDRLERSTLVVAVPTSARSSASLRPLDRELVGADGRRDRAGRARARRASGPTRQPRPRAPAGRARPRAARAPAWRRLGRWCGRASAAERSSWLARRRAGAVTGRGLRTPPSSGGRSRPDSMASVARPDPARATTVAWSRGATTATAIDRARGPAWLTQAPRRARTFWLTTWEEPPGAIVTP